MIVDFSTTRTARQWVHEVVESEDKKSAGMVFADWLEERGDERAKNVRELFSKENFSLRDSCYRVDWNEDLVSEFSLPMLLDGDWQEVFDYAKYGSDITKADPTEDGVSLDTFLRVDVESILAFSEGENDGENWLICGLLFDGRWFFIEAGCDYTGWG